MVRTNKVTDMYYHVIRSLFEENPSVFSHPDIKAIAGISTNPDDLRAPFKINSSYFIETNIDSNTKFKKLKSLLTKFNREDDLLINFANSDTEDSDSEEKGSEEIDRDFWEEKSSRESLEALDACFKIINEAEPDTKLNYTKSYVGLTLISKHTNLARLTPKHSFLKATIFVTDTEEWIKKLESAGFKVHLKGRDSDRFIFRTDYENILPKILIKGFVCCCLWILPGLEQGI